jgi:hypothetical protein
LAYKVKEGDSILISASISLNPLCFGYEIHGYEGDILLYSVYYLFKDFTFCIIFYLFQRLDQKSSDSIRINNTGNKDSFSMALFLSFNPECCKVSFSKIILKRLLVVGSF